MSDKRIAIVMPTNILKGAMCATATDKYRPILRSVCIRGRSWPIKDGGKHVELSVVATDSYQLVEFDYSYGIAADADVDVPDKFEWAILPNDKLAGASDYVRIEPNAEGTAANVRTYKGVVSFGQAMADMSPTSYHVWDMPEGKYPNVDGLWPESLTTVANVEVSLDVLGTVAKAITTAYGAKTRVTFTGVSTKGAALAYEVHDDNDNRIARAVLMPTAKCQPDKGAISGADPGELASTRKALEEMHRLNAEKADTISKMSDRIAELGAALDHAIARYDELEAALEDAEPEIVEPDEIIAVDGVEVAQVTHDELPALPEPNTVIEPSDPVVLAIVPATASPTHVVAYWVPEGCTVRVSKGGNVWLDGPKEVTKANRVALKNAGWQWAVKRQQWWRKVA